MGSGLAHMSAKVKPCTQNMSVFCRGSVLADQPCCCTNYTVDPQVKLLMMARSKMGKEDMKLYMKVVLCAKFCSQYLG